MVVDRHFPLRTLLTAAPRRALMLLVHGYRLLLRPLLQPSCRYELSCSAYALEALTRHGAAGGSYLALHRLLRCHPFCAGGVDLVPEHRPTLFTRFVRNEPAGHPASRPMRPAPRSTSIPQSLP